MSLSELKFALINYYNHRVTLITAIIIFLFISGYFYKRTALSYPFVDEQYNFVIGKYLQRGEILYDDIITNHQPIAHIFSALVQNARNPNTTFSLLTSHRAAVTVWSGIWGLLLVVYFGMGGFLFVILYELTKSYMFGNLFLAEAILVYPFVFITGVVLGFKKLTRFTLFLLGISLSLTFFTLGPVWPALFFLSLLLTLQLKKNYKEKLPYLIFGALAAVLLISKYVSFSGYLHDYLYINYTYTIPQYHDAYYRESWSITVLKAIITPVLSFIKDDVTPVLWIIRILSLILLLNAIDLVRKGRLINVLAILFLLGLCNIRFTYPGNGYYGGFHLLPWYSVFIFTTMAVVVKEFKHQHNILKLANLFLIIAAFVIGVKFAQGIFIDKKDLQVEYTTNYSTHTDFGQIIKIMKSGQDTLFVSPDAWLVYWQSDALHIPKLFGYYTWLNGIPQFHKKILESFEKNPPTFFYCENCKGLDLEKFLNQYQQIEKFGDQSLLFVLPSRINNQTKQQRDQLKFYGVE